MVRTKPGLTKRRLRKSHFDRNKRKKLHLHRRHYLIGGALLLLALALAVGANAKWWGSDSVTVPEHTRIHVVLDQAVSTRSGTGHHFRATISKPVVIDGKTVIPKGARAEGVVVEAKEAGRIKGRPRLLLALQSVDVNGQNYPVHTWASRETGHSRTKKHYLLWMGGGAGGGVLIGALAGGATGAAIGGPVGLAAGTTVALVTAKRDVKLRPETPLTFRLARPATISVKS